MAMVSWGLLVSLILMPVLLSMCGPLVCTIGPRETRAQRLQAKRERKAAQMTMLCPALGRNDDCDWDGMKSNIDHDDLGKGRVTKAHTKV